MLVNNVEQAKPERETAKDCKAAQREVGELGRYFFPASEEEMFEGDGCLHLIRLNAAVWYILLFTCLFCSFLVFETWSLIAQASLELII